MIPWFSGGYYDSLLSAILFLRLLFLFTDNTLVLLIIPHYCMITHPSSSQLLLHPMSLLDDLFLLISSLFHIIFLTSLSFTSSITMSQP